MRYSALVCSVLLHLLCAPRVFATPLFEQVGGFAGLGALQARHTGASAASAYFNPALLPDAEVGLSAGVLVLDTNIGVRVAARASSDDVPNGLVNASHADGSRLEQIPIASDLLQNGRAARGYEPAFQARPRQRASTGRQTYTYEAIGVVLKLFRGQLALGYYGLIPNRNFVSLSSFYPDEREQYFSNSLHPELYGDRLTAVSMAVAAGLRISNELSIGTGISIGAGARADAPVYVADAGALQDLQLNTKVGAKIALVPHLGAAWSPLRRLHFTATVHAPHKLDIEARFRFLLGTGTEQSSGIALLYDYQPWQCGAGATYDVVASSHTTLSATASLLYARWSKYIDRHSERPSGAYAWGDTLMGALGARLASGPLSVALDGRYVPTPVPLQTGRTNYVDNDRLGVALVFEYAFSLLETPFKVGAQLQAERLLSRSQSKHRPPTVPQGRNVTPQLVTDEAPDDAVVGGEPIAGTSGLQTNNPGWPGFSSAGLVSSAGLYLKVAL